MKINMMIIFYLLSMKIFAGDQFKCQAMQKNIQLEVIRNSKTGNLILSNFDGFEQYFCQTKDSKNYCCNITYSLKKYKCQLRYIYTYKYNLLEFEQDDQALAFECFD